MNAPLNQVKISVHPDHAECPALFDEQVEMVRTIASANGVHIRRHVQSDDEITFNVYTENGANVLIDAFERFDDNVPHSGAFFHIWNLTDLATGREVQMPVKIDTSWD